MKYSYGISTSALASLMGCSVDTLYRLRDAGIFKMGVRNHYWPVNPTAARLTYRWHQERCLKVWDQLHKQLEG